MKRNQQPGSGPHMGTAFNADFRSTPGVDRKLDLGSYQSIFVGCNMPFAFLDLDLLEQNICCKAVRLVWSGSYSMLIFRWEMIIVLKGKQGW
jgi:hypothetical protein